MYPVEVIGNIADLVRTAFDLPCPYEPRLAVEKLGGKIVRDDNTVVDASVKKEGAESFIISLNPNKYPHDNAQGRLAIAHELGHLFLHMGFLIKKKLWKSISEETYMSYSSETLPKNRTREELEADEFAAAFLMPRKEFDRQIYQNKSKDGIINVNDIANYFAVSPKMILTRARWLGYVEWW